MTKDERIELLEALDKCYQLAYDIERCGKPVGEYANKIREVVREAKKSITRAVQPVQDDPNSLTVSYMVGYEKDRDSRTQSVQTDKECARLIRRKCCITINGEPTLAPNLAEEIIAAHRTAAERQAKAEAWEEVVEDIKQRIDNLLKEYETEDDRRRNLKERLFSALPNPYKENRDG